MNKHGFEIILFNFPVNGYKFINNLLFLKHSLISIISLFDREHIISISTSSFVPSPFKKTNYTFEITEKWKDIFYKIKKGNFSKISHAEFIFLHVILSNKLQF